MATSTERVRQTKNLGLHSSRDTQAVRAEHRNTEPVSGHQQSPPIAWPIGLKKVPLTRGTSNQFGKLIREVLGDSFDVIAQ
jgi:hypothetical protein